MARELNAKIRTTKGRHAAKRLRNEALIPAVMYRDGLPGTNLTIEEKDWVKTLASGQRVVNLKMEGGDRQALIKDVQYDHLGGATLHVDFNELREGQKVRLAVGVVLKGVPKGAGKGGILSHAMHALHIECLPNDIPEKITIDIEHMDLDSYIHVSDVKLGAALHALDDAQLVICSVHEPRGEKEADEGAPTEPEVLTAKKEVAPAEGAAAKKDEKKK